MTMAGASYPVAISTAQTARHSIILQRLLLAVFCLTNENDELDAVLYIIYWYDGFVSHFFATISFNFNSFARWCTQNEEMAIRFYS